MILHSNYIFLLIFFYDCFNKMWKKKLYICFLYLWSWLYKYNIYFAAETDMMERRAIIENIAREKMSIDANIIENMLMRKVHQMEDPQAVALHILVVCLNHSGEKIRPRESIAARGLIAPNFMAHGLVVVLLSAVLLSIIFSSLIYFEHSRTGVG